MPSRSSKKPMKGSLGTSFIIEKIPGKRLSCSSCIHYSGDGSCMKRPVVMSEVGYDFYRNCKDFTLHNGSQPNKTKKNKKTTSTNRTIIVEKQVKEQVNIKGKLPILNNIDPVISNMKIADKVKQLLDEYEDLNYISQKLYEDKYKLFLTYDRFYKKYNDRALDEKVIYELRELGLANKQIAKFYGVGKKQISLLAKTNTPPAKKSTKSSSKGPKVSNVIKRLKIDKDEDDILSKAMKNKQDLYAQGMSQYVSNPKKTENYLDHCVTKNGEVSVERLSKHVNFLEKHNLATPKELNKYYEILDNYNKKQTNRKRKR